MHHPPKMDPKWTQNGPKLDPNSTQTRPRMDPKWTQNGPKMDPKWTQNGPKMDPKWPQNGHGAWHTKKRVPMFPMNRVFVKNVSPVYICVISQEIRFWRSQHARRSWTRQAVRESVQFCEEDQFQLTGRNRHEVQQHHWSKQYLICWRVEWRNSRCWCCGDGVTIQAPEF